MNHAPVSPAGPESPPLAARIGLFAGPVLALVVYFLLPGGDGSAAGGLTHAGRACGSVATLMAVWWMTEALPLEATALLPLVLLPLAGVYPPGTGASHPFHRAAAPFADPAIFLFLGGFLIALAIERWGLHRRIALLTVLAVGTQPARLIGGFMLATALVSMWISNTATTVMMLPIGLSVVALLHSRLANPSDTRNATEGVPYSADVRNATEGIPNTADVPNAPESADAANFATCLLLGIAYAASLGGFATLIGTPPNVFFKGYMEQRGLPIDFLRWMLFAAPLAGVYLLLAWALLTKLIFPVRMTCLPGGRELIAAEYRKLGPVSRGEWTVLVVFLCTASLWIGGQYLKRWEALVALVPAIRSLDDPLAAMLGAIALFLIPVDGVRGHFALDWKTALKLPWGVLLLFGGGLSLAAAITDSGLAAWIGQQVSGLKSLPTYWQVTLVVALIVFSGELTNNLAAVVAILPILFEVVLGLDVDPRLLCIPAVVAASCGFMLPVATPPNAIAFATGHIRLGQMIRAGLALDLLAVVLIPPAIYALGWLVGIGVT